MTTIEITLSVPDDILEYLKQEAARRDVALEVVVSDVLSDYYREPTEAEILEGIRMGMRDALRGNVRPARDVLDEIEAEDHAN